MFGGRCVETYSHTQETRALSLGESELYGIVKGATMGLSMNCLLIDMGANVELQVNTDSSVARSTRQGEELGRSDTST